MSLNQRCSLSHGRPVQTEQLQIGTSQVIIYLSVKAPRTLTLQAVDDTVLLVQQPVLKKIYSDWTLARYTIMFKPANPNIFHVFTQPKVSQAACSWKLIQQL